MFSGKSRASSNTKSQAAAAVRPAQPSLLAPDLRIEGNLVSVGDVQLDGSVTGDVFTRKLTIGEKAQITGAIVAETVRIAGAVYGEITAMNVELTSTAKVTGDINHDTLSIDAGAYIQGLCRRMDSGQKRRVEEVITGRTAAETESEDSPVDDKVIALEGPAAKASAGA